MKTKLTFILALIILSISSVSVANAQWADPGGTWTGVNEVPVIDISVVPDAPVVVEPSIPDEPAVVESEIPTVETTVIPDVKPESVPVVEQPTIVDPKDRVPTPKNPYENLPAGAIPPDRPVTPPNPYENLPPGVKVPRPSTIPCTIWTERHCPGGIFPG